MTEIKELGVGPSIGAKFGNLVLSNKGLVLVVYLDPSCLYSRNFMPVLEDIAAEIKGGVTIVKVNIKNHPAFIKDHNVRATPDTRLFKNGKKIKDWGCVTAKDEIIERIQGELKAKIFLLPPRETEAKSGLKQGCLMHSL